MQGSMKWVVAVMAAVLTLAVAGIFAATSQAQTTGCSDLSYLTSAVKVAKKNVASLRLAKQDRYSAALVPANAGLWIAKHSAVPCDEGTEQYWLHRQYSIRYEVALVRYLEESKRGNYDRADTYMSSMQFWMDEMQDITYAW